eukprot:351361-Chlamydomonas_euryale.AAC.13
MPSRSSNASASASSASQLTRHTAGPVGPRGSWLAGIMRSRGAESGTASAVLFSWSRGVAVGVTGRLPSPSLPAAVLSSCRHACGLPTAKPGLAAATAAAASEASITDLVEMPAAPLGRDGPAPSPAGCCDSCGHCAGGCAVGLWSAVERRLALPADVAGLPVSPAKRLSACGCGRSWSGEKLPGPERRGIGAPDSIACGQACRRQGWPNDPPATNGLQCRSPGCANALGGGGRAASCGASLLRPAVAVRRALLWGGGEEGRPPVEHRCSDLPWPYGEHFCSSEEGSSRRVDSAPESTVQSSPSRGQSPAPGPRTYRTARISPSVPRQATLPTLAVPTIALVEALQTAGD